MNEQLAAAAKRLREQDGSIRACRTADLLDALVEEHGPLGEHWPGDPYDPSPYSCHCFRAALALAEVIAPVQFSGDDASQQ